MRSRLLLSASLILGIPCAGCFDYLSDKDIFQQSGTTSAGGSGGGTGTGGTGTGGTGGVTGTGGTGGSTTITSSPECVPSNNSSPVEDDCGVFVSSSLGDDAGAGTKASPVKSIVKALELAHDRGSPVYACGEAFSGPVSLSGASLLYGSLDCATTWKYDPGGARTTLSASSGEIPLRVAAAGSVELHDFDVVAADGMAQGASSIAVLAEAGATLKLVQCDVIAGDGAFGGDQQSIPVSAQAGTDGSNGIDACLAAQSVPVDPPVNDCGGEPSIGGVGGIGASSSPVAGGAGEPGAAINNNAGGPEGFANQCGSGKEGLAGDNGEPGMGATANSAILSAAAGYSGGAGADGLPGKTAQGGGGGGGAKGGTGAGKCSDSTKAAGASGAPGGSGGCGGLGGKGGLGGGASIAIVSLGAALAFEGVTLTVKNGGDGGNGAQGQPGGAGGSGGLGGKAAGFANLSSGCSGGKGGHGGAGGDGGGGLGGPSIGVAYTGNTPPDTSGATIVLGTPGLGGNAGGPGTGADGVALETLGF